MAGGRRRALTPDLFYEARRALSSGELCRKTIFVADLPNLDATFAARLRDVSHAVLVTTPDITDVALRIKKERLTLPSAAKSLAGGGAQPRIRVSDSLEHSHYEDLQKDAKRE